MENGLFDELEKRTLADDSLVFSPFKYAVGVPTMQS